MRVRVRPRVRVSAPGPRVRPRVRVHPGVASWFGSRNVTSSKNNYAYFGMNP